MKGSPMKNYPSCLPWILVVGESPQLHGRGERCAELHNDAECGITLALRDVEIVRVLVPTAVNLGMAVKV